MIRAIWNRIYADFFMPSRLPEYAQLLSSFLDADYATWTHVQLAQAVQRQQPLPKRLLLLRHDIDTDPTTAAKMWAIEKNLGVTSTFYFRLSTFVPRLMEKIEKEGGEASYHYEELSTEAKKRGWKRKEDAVDSLPQIRSIFKKNLSELRRLSGLPMLTVASHGDFANRFLGVTNTLILEDPSLRKEMGIFAEAYDPWITALCNQRQSDKPYPRFWGNDGNPPRPLSQQDSSSHVFYLLTHPRHWQTRLWENAADNLERIQEGLAYRLKRF